MVVFGEKLLYSGKVTVFGQKWLYSSKSCCNWPSGCFRIDNSIIRTKWLYLGKVVVLGQKWFYS